MSLGGFAGKILHVDLTRGKITDIPLDENLAEKYIGGLGLTVKIAYDRITPGTDALDPENPIVLGVGPLVGTNLPASSRVYAVTRLPAGGTVGWCGAGGFTFGCMLKYAGYDHVIIEGRSELPVYLKIIDDQLELADARTLWGQGVAETAETLWQEHGHSAGVLTIGPSGENRVKFSMAFINRISTLGRGGFGAVMGSKNLKAVVVRGNQSIAPADPKKYRSLSKGLFRTIREYPYLKEWQDLGMMKSFPLIPLDIYDRIKKKRLACVSCPIGCKDVVEIQDGEHQGRVIYSSSAVNLFMPMIYGIRDYRQAVSLIADLDEYGLDMFEFFGLMGLAKNLHDLGIINADSVQPDIAVDSPDSLRIWAEKIAFREGLGHVLADGFYGLCEAFGPEVMEHAPAVIKGMIPYAGPGAALPWDLFGTMELGQILDPRGPHVGSGGSPTYFAKRPLDVFPKHLSRMGVPAEAVKRILPGQDNPAGPRLEVGRLLKYSHAWFTTLGSLGICARAQINRFYNAALCAELYEAVTGIPTTWPELSQRVDRAWTLLRMANVREGLNRNDEIPPEKWFKTPGFKEYLTEKPMTRSESEQMIGDYYHEWGWDPQTGIPSEQILKDLDLVELV